MKKILIIANTYYQLIMSIQLNYTLFLNDKVTLLLSDHSNNAEIIYKRLESKNIFSEIVFISTKGTIKSRNIPNRLIDIIKIANGQKNRFTKCLDMIKTNKSLVYDELICFNFSMDIYGVFSYLQRFNSDIDVSMYEEGVLSYGLFPVPTTGRKIVNRLRHLFGKKNIVDCYKSFYCFYPNLYKGDFEAIKVPLVSKGDQCSLLLRDIFDINENKSIYQEKYIFFSSVYDFEGGSPIGEFDLVMKIADLVGKNNLLIKTHPRDNRTIFKDNGFHIDSNSNIPWEAIQLSRDFSDKIFLTVNSGSVLAGSLMSEHPTRTFYLFRLCNLSGNLAAQKNVKDIEELIDSIELKKALRKVSIANEIEDILE